MIWNTCWTCGQSSWATNIALRNNIDVRNFESRQQPAGMHAFNNFPIMYELSGCPVIVIKRWTALTLSLQPCPNLQDPPSYMAWHQITRNKPQYGTYRRVRSQNLVAALFPVSIGARKQPPDERFGKTRSNPRIHFFSSTNIAIAGHFRPSFAVRSESPRR